MIQVNIKVVFFVFRRGISKKEEYMFFVFPPRLSINTLAFYDERRSLIGYATIFVKDGK